MNLTPKFAIIIYGSLFLLIPFFAFAQRIIDTSRYTAAYYDSVRATVNAPEEQYVLQAYRLSPGENITIDGRLEEPAWKMAHRADDFIEKEPYPLVPFGEETEFAFLYDEENIYFGVWCWDSEPDKIVRQLNPRGTSSGDNIQIFLDTYHDRRTGYKFTISPSGVQGDELRYDDIKRDFNWNGIWESAGHIDGKGWYAEVRIPLFNLRFRENETQTWGVNVMRTIAKTASRGQWKPHLPEWEINTRMSTLGEVTGIRAVGSGRMFEIRPYGITGAAETAATDTEKKIGGGLDLRFSPSSSITADITVNPDFAQVDADVLVVNLTRFPTRFLELRPFFTERTNIFNTPMELFYSRRVGAVSDIITGAKLSGKLQNGTEFGGLACITGNSPFSNFQTNLQASEKANFGVVRLKKDLFNSSTIGILAATKESADQYNRTLGVDASFALQQTYLLDAQVAKGSTESNKDRDMAYHGSLQIPGDLFGFTVSANRVEPFFEINDIGFLRKEASRGWNTINGQARWNPRLNRHHVRRLLVSLQFEGRQDLFTDAYIDDWLIDNPEIAPDPEFGDVVTDGPGLSITGGRRTFENWQANAATRVEFLNEARLTLDYANFRDTEVTGSYHGQSWGIRLSSRSTQGGANFQAIAGLSGGDYYNFRQKYPGKRTTATLTSRGRLGTRILTSLEGEYTRTLAPDTQRDGRFWQFSSNTTFMFNKDFYFRLHLQGRFETTYFGAKATENDYLLSTLLSWQYKPGAFFYIAYNEGRIDEADRFRNRKFIFNDRTLVIKLSYLFNI
jgi:hypothetical protein